jgi:ribosome-associated toxin RatA of RatAB toxin-antitoxin module
MAQAEHREVLSCDRDTLFKVIADYASYPSFVDGVKSVKVDRDGGKIQASYAVSMVKDVSYRLNHVEDSAQGVISWTLLDSDFFKKNDGRWELKSVGPGKTEALYRLDVEFKIPVPGFMLSRLVKGSLPSMVKSFEKRAQAVAKGGK